MPQAVPMITLYRPVHEGNRWLARADVVAKGELIQLQATASDKLAKRAQGWYNKAAEYVSRWITYADGPPERLGAGAFGDMPVVAFEVAKAIESMPGRLPTMEAARDALVNAEAGDAAALQHIEQTAQMAAAGDADAQKRHRAFCLMHDVLSSGGAGVAFGPVIAGAASGDPRALGTFSAMRCCSPALPARIQYSVDEFECAGDGCEIMTGDVIGATLYELVSPRKRSVHRVSPGRYRPAIEALRAIHRNGARGIPPSIQPRGAY